jgi:hypothetical protein
MSAGNTMFSNRVEKLPLKKMQKALQDSICRDKSLFIAFSR